MTMRLKNRLNQIGLLLFLCTAMILTSCEKNADTILEEEGITVDDLVGKWSITSISNVVTDADDVELHNETESIAHNMETVQFSSDNSMLLISVEEGSWTYGDFVLNEVENTIDFDFDADESQVLQIIDLSTTSAQFQVVEESEQDGSIVTSTNTITLTKNTGSEAGIDEADLKTRWSMGSNNVYVDNQLITSDILDNQWLETVATINENRYTFDLTTSTDVLAVDNYMTGTYEKGTLVVLDRSNFVLELADNGDPILFHITASSGSTDLEVVYFKNISDEDVKVQQDWSSDFTTPTLSALIMDGTWEITGKTAGEETNGQTVTAGDDGPQIGNVMEFNSDETGAFEQDPFTFEFIDDNNIILTSSGDTDYSLIRFESYNGTDVISLWTMKSEWNDMNTSFEQEWFKLDLVKQ